MADSSGNRDAVADKDGDRGGDGGVEVEVEEGVGVEGLELFKRPRLTDAMILRISVWV